MTFRIETVWKWNTFIYIKIDENSTQIKNYERETFTFWKVFKIGLKSRLFCLHFIAILQF